MPALPNTQIANGPGTADRVLRGQVSTRGSAQFIDIAQVTAARDKLATLVAEGELWALPLFTRIEAELAQLTARDAALARARQIAGAAVLKRAA